MIKLTTLPTCIYKHELARAIVSHVFTCSTHCCLFYKYNKNAEIYQLSIMHTVIVVICSVSCSQGKLNYMGKSSRSTTLFLKN